MCLDYIKGCKMLVNRYDIINANLGVATTTVISMLRRATSGIHKQVIVQGKNRHGACKTIRIIAHYNVDEAISDYESRLKDPSLVKYRERTERIIKVLTELRHSKEQ